MVRVSFTLGIVILLITSLLILNFEMTREVNSVFESSLISGFPAKDTEKPIYEHVLPEEVPEIEENHLDLDTITKGLEEIKEESAEYVLIPTEELPEAELTKAEELRADSDGLVQRTRDLWGSATNFNPDEDYSTRSSEKNIDNSLWGLKDQYGQPLELQCTGLKLGDLFDKLAIIYGSNEEAYIKFQLLCGRVPKYDDLGLVEAIDGCSPKPYLLYQHLITHMREPIADKAFRRICSWVGFQENPSGYEVSLEEARKLCETNDAALFAQLREYYSRGGQDVYYALEEICPESNIIKQYRKYWPTGGYNLDEVEQDYTVHPGSP